MDALTKSGRRTEPKADASTEYRTDTTRPAAPLDGVPKPKGATKAKPRHGDGEPAGGVKLVLEDGTELSGRAFGAVAPIAGEVVFNTGMTGYVEALTDPSYRGQILVLTYPLIGNYGVPAPRTEGSIEGPYESDHIQVEGLVVQNYVPRYSHASAARSLGAWLAAEGVPAVTGIDTRMLTRRLRESGTMQGWLFPDDMSTEEAKSVARPIDMRHVFDLVTASEIVRYPGGDLTILLLDIGAKDNIVRSLVKRGASVIRAGLGADWTALAQEADGVLLGNGPGDPKDLDKAVGTLSALLADYEKPVFGICLGNQLLARAAGAETYKLKYGHRGVNQPVQDLLTKRCFVTSQNHGYAVDDASLPAGWEPWFVNLNDGTNEGIRARTKPFFSIQFHPEASPGPMDSGVLFDDFLRLVGSIKRR